MSVRWNGDSATRRVRAKLGRNLEKAAEALWAVIRVDISVQGPPRSSPGNPPHKDTGALYDDYFFAVDTANLVAMVGSTMPRDPYLEFGTPKMAARPHVRGTMVAMWPALVNIIFS